jgi:hypothetical protein
VAQNGFAGLDISVKLVGLFGMSHLKTPCETIKGHHMTLSETDYYFECFFIYLLTFF